jgi:tachykinin-like receptor
MVVVAAGGNLIVVWIVLGHRRMRTVTNYFLVNLAVADTLITVLNTMFNFIYLLHSHWPFSNLHCKFNHFISSCTIAASVFTFMAIAFDRQEPVFHSSARQHNHDVKKLLLQNALSGAISRVNSRFFHV